MNSANAILHKWRSEGKLILEHFFTCEFRDLDLTHLDAELLSHNQKSKTLADCVHRARYLKSYFQSKIPTIPGSRKDTDTVTINYKDDKDLWHCLVEAEQVCLASEVKVLKETRLMIRDLEPMLTNDPDLHIILLVRDPRASLWYRAAVFKENPGSGVMSTFIHSNCNVLDDDVSVTLDLHKRFPGRVKLLRFESLAEDPIQVCRQLYRYLGIQWNRQIQRLISAQASADKIPTPRGMSTDATEGARVIPQRGSARAWREGALWSFVQIAQDKCFSVMRLLGYQLFRLEHELRGAGSRPGFADEEAAIPDPLWLH